MIRYDRLKVKHANKKYSSIHTFLLRFGKTNLFLQRNLKVFASFFILVFILFISFIISKQHTKICAPSTLVTYTPTKQFRDFVSMRRQMAAGTIVGTGA